MPRMLEEGVVRMCQGRLCDNAADLWWHGPWCAKCALKLFGRVPFEMAKLAIHEASRPVTGAAPGTTFRVVPVKPGAEAVASPPAPLFDDDLVALLERRGWDELDLELDLVARMGGDL